MIESLNTAQKIADMTIRMESGDNPPSNDDVYQMLLLAMIEIRSLAHLNNVLRDKLAAKGV